MGQWIVVALGLGLLVLTMCGVKIGPPQDSAEERARNQAVIDSFVPQEEKDAKKAQYRAIFESIERDRQRKLLEKGGTGAAPTAGLSAP